MAISSAQRMFCRPGNLFDIQSSLSWLKIPYDVVSAFHLSRLIWTGEKKEPSV